jgi:hypothetical protein
VDELIGELPHLTERQFDALVWVCRYWAVHRHGPTHREVTAGLGGSVVTAALVDKGYLERTAATSRNIRPTATTFEKLKHEGVILNPPKQSQHRTRRGKTGG